jgi:hypothetical protein
MLGLNMAGWDWIAGLPRRYASRKDGFLWIGLLVCRVATLLVKTDFWDWVIGLRRRYASRKDEVPWNGGKEKNPPSIGS